MLLFGWRCLRSGLKVFNYLRVYTICMYIYAALNFFFLILTYLWSTGPLEDCAMSHV